MIIIMLGAQGTGKGTVAGLISEQTGWPQVSTGDIFRKNISEKTELGIEADKYISKGNLVPDEITVPMVEDRLTWEDAQTYYPTQEIMRYTNEIARMTSSANPSFKTGKTMIFECANLKFQACRENRSLAYTDKVIQYSKSGVFDMNYIVNVVSKIIIETDGTVTVEMINGTKINNREVGNANAGKKNRNENRCESDFRKAE